jgi:hypothetical protein
MVAAFGAYFAMYAFRKPVTVLDFDGAAFRGGSIALKTALLVGQTVGYAFSKFAGIVVCSTIPRRRRGWALVLLVMAAQVTLVAFAVVPPDWRVAVLFANGLPLGMVWGLVVRYVEGRRTSDVLLAGLSASFIVSSGVVKDVGRWLLHLGVPEMWMPAAAGALFVAPFLTCVAVLERSPAPDLADEEARTVRRAMTRAERTAFLARFGVGLAPLVLVYGALTAYRDFRDNYGLEIFRELGYLDLPALFTRTELPAGLGVLVTLGLLNLIRGNRRALGVTYVIMAGGCSFMALTTWLHAMGLLDGIQWMTMVGVGAYLAYVPVSALFFERLVAADGSAGTAVLGIYVADAFGYTGSVGVQLYRDVFAGSVTRLSFFQDLTWMVGCGGTLLILLSAGVLFRTLDGR